MPGTVAGGRATQRTHINTEKQTGNPGVKGVVETSFVTHQPCIEDRGL